MDKLNGIPKCTVGRVSLEFKRVIWTGDKNLGILGISVFKVMRPDDIDKGVCVGREEGHACLGEEKQLPKGD